MFYAKNVASANSVEEFEKPFCISLRIISRFITSASSDFIWYLFVGFNDILQHMQFFTKLHNWMDSTIKVAKVYLLQRNLYRKNSPNTNIISNLNRLKTILNKVVTLVYRRLFLNIPVSQYHH